MSVKQSLSNYPSNKRRKVSTRLSDDNLVALEDSDDFELSEVSRAINDTKAAVLYLRSLFPMKEFKGKVPPIVLKHQIYDIISNRTTVDRELNDLWEKNEVFLFQIMQGSDEFLVVLAEDFYSHAKEKINENNKSAIDKFLSGVLRVCHEVSVSKTVLTTNYKLSDDEITHLVNAGLLSTRDVGSYWFGIPGAGLFMKSFILGRKAILRILKKSKFKEMLQKDLEERKVASFSKLGMIYHIHDVLGADIVRSISTTSGPLLRLNEQKESSSKSSRR